MVKGGRRWGHPRHHLKVTQSMSLCRPSCKLRRRWPRVEGWASSTPCQVATRYSWDQPEVCCALFFHAFDNNMLYRQSVTSECGYPATLNWQRLCSGLHKLLPWSMKPKILWFSPGLLPLTLKVSVSSLPNFLLAYT